MSSDSSTNLSTGEGQEAIRQLLSPDRQSSADPLRVFSFTEISYTDKVGDIGCGPGYFTLPLAKALYNGQVYALDIDPEMLAACRERLAQAHLGNVELLQCGEFDFPVEPGSLDGVLLAFVVSHTTDQLRFLQAVRTLLKPRGWCSVLEWRRQETEHGPPLEQRKNPDELEALVTEAGFRYREWRRLNEDQYVLSMRNE